MRVVAVLYDDGKGVFYLDPGKASSGQEVNWSRKNDMIRLSPDPGEQLRMALDEDTPKTMGQD